MAQEHWQDCGKEPAKDVDVKTGKTVRFQNNTRDICDSKMTAGAVPVVPGQHQGAPGSNNPAINMVQNLVPHLPGLDKDKVYVISGPFPNFDPVNGPSQLLMATPVTSGATVIAVPTGPPPPVSCGKTHHQQPGQQPVAGGQHQVYRSPNPQMLHWDNHHPGGQIIPLRQPNPPVYYNVPGSGSSNSSGLQSPASEGGSCMSESSSTSGDQDSEQLQLAAAAGKQLLYPAGPNMMYPMPQMMGYHGRPYQGPPPYCHMPGPGMGQMMMYHNGTPGQMVPQQFNQMFISQ